jgi:hypothetical protein
MKKSLTRYITGLLLLACYACQQERPVQQRDSVQLSKPTPKEAMAAPADFCFGIRDEVNTLNSCDSTYRRRYLSRDSVVALLFSQRELDRIYASYRENGIDTMPEEYDAGCKTAVLPTFVQELTITHNGQVRKLTYNSDYECSSTVTSGQLRRISTFLRFVEAIVEKKEAVKKLKETDIVFM